MENSSFRMLPSELRNVVYEMLLTHDCPLSLAALSSFKGITEACRVLRYETRKFFWARNNFYHICYESGPRAEKAASSMSVFLSHHLGSAILNTAGPIIFHHRPWSRSKCAEMIIFSGTQSDARNPQGNLGKWQRNIGGFGKLGPNSDFLRQILRAYDHLGFDVYALCENRHFNWVECAIRETDEEISERLAVCRRYAEKHYEFCVVMPQEDDD